MSLVLYNTLSRKKEEFQPIEPKKVTMYVCGPTVYGLLHVGNFRGPVFFNLVRNWLEKSGYNVDYAYNYTDVDDRIIAKANELGIKPEEVSEKYIDEFQTDFKALGLRKHTYNPKVTDCMEPIVKIIDDLVKNEKAYVAADGEVLYSVRSFDGYGKLSGRNLDELQAGSRVEIDQKKKDPMDFALWKPAKPGEPKWPSPWCDGRPGWHIECSAMVRSIFGDSIDIHGGGADLIFPHHENEIAQSEGASHKHFARYWMHNNMLTFGEKKMSKSLGNIMTARDFLTKYDAEIMKYMLLSVHYRSLSDFSEQGIGFAITGLAKIYSALNLAVRTIETGPGGTIHDVTLLLEKLKVLEPEKTTASFAKALAEADKAATDALNDDFNTPELFAAIYGLIRVFNSQVRLGAKSTPELVATAQAFYKWVLSKGELLSLFQHTPSEYLRSLDDRLLLEGGIERAHVDALVKERAEARAAKDFKRSDELRDELTRLKISVHDTPTGSAWEVTK